MRMRYMKRIFCAALALAGALGLAATARAETCSTTMTSASVDGSLLVPKGPACILKLSTVTGNITVEPGGCLQVDGSDVGGNITATDALCLAIYSGSMIGGNVTALGTTGNLATGANFLCNATIGGSVEINGSGTGAPWCIGMQSCLSQSGFCVTTLPLLNIIGNLTFDNNKGAANTISDTTIGSNLNCANNSNLTGSGNTASRKLGQCKSF